MKPTSDPEHDRAFASCLVMNHFNSVFLSFLAPTKQQLIDKYTGTVKYKSHSKASSTGLQNVVQM